MRTRAQRLEKLPPERVARIEARTQELIAEEMTLKELRKARALSQETLAEVLEWRQGDLSKFERRADAYLSTIRRYVEAMGGTLDLVATFPNMPPVKLIHIGDLNTELADARSTASKSARTKS